MDCVLHQPSGLGSGKHRKQLERVTKVLLPLLSFFLQDQGVPNGHSPRDKAPIRPRRGLGPTGPFLDPEAITASCQAGVSSSHAPSEPCAHFAHSLFLKSPQLILSLPSVFSTGTLIQISILALMDKQTCHSTFKYF